MVYAAFRRTSHSVRPLLDCFCLCELRKNHYGQNQIYILKQISTYTGEPRILYQKEFEFREPAKLYRNNVKPILEKMHADNPALPYIKHVIEEV